MRLNKTLAFLTFSVIFGFFTQTVSAYYSPEVGRFISRDPIEYEAEDANLYQYVGNVPVSATDALGLRKCGPRVWIYTGDWCVDDNVWDAAMDAAGNIVHCWWRCEIQTHKCIAGQTLLVTETVSGVWSVATSRIPKMPDEIYNPNDKLKGLVRDIIRNRIPGGMDSTAERIARASTRGYWGKAAGVAKGTFVVTVMIETGISAYCSYTCSH